MSPTDDDPNLFAELGHGHRDRWTGPEWHRRLRGPRGVKEYRELRDNCAVVGAAFFAVESLIAQSTFKVKPTSDTPTESQQFWADFVQGEIDGLESTWETHLFQALTAMTYGWSWFEVVYDLRGKRVGWKKWGFRSQETLAGWEWSEDLRELVGLRQGSYGGGVRGGAVIPLAKSVHYRLRPAGDVHGDRGMLQSQVCQIVSMERIPLQVRKPPC